MGATEIPWKEMYFLLVKPSDIPFHLDNLKSQNPLTVEFTVYPDKQSTR